MSDNVAVLLASFNGGRYIAEQVLSILKQEDVDAYLCISDDGSSDNTLQCISAISEQFPGRVSLLNGCRPPELSARNSANNFYYLIASLDLPPHIRWVAFSDQDDLWHPLHLSRAISIIAKLSLAGYSSSVLAFWPDGRLQLIRKDGNISRYNHIFEAPGPGCSFVLPRETYDSLRLHLLKNLASAAKIDFHDWAIFAFVRGTGGGWYIDSWPSIMYRQHDLNVLGAQLTPRSISKRFKMLLGGWYREQCLAVAGFCGQLNERPAHLLRSLSLFDRLRLALTIARNRRRLRDRILVALVSIFMLSQQKSTPLQSIRDAN